MIVCAPPQPAEPRHDCTRASNHRAHTWLFSKILAAILALIGACDSAPAQLVLDPNPTPLSTEFAIETWRTDNGLPQNTVTAVLQTRRGYLWSGTYNGIAQFDGLRFTIFDSAHSPGLANGRVTSLHEDSRGEIWIGHDTGEVSHYANDNFRSVKMGTAWSRIPIKDFAEDEQGDLWTLNQLGDAVRLRDQRIVQPPALMRESPFVNPRVTRDGARRNYVVRNGVVMQLTSAGYVPVNFGDPSPRPYYAGVGAARDGTLWVVGEGKLRKWDGTNWLAQVADFSWADVSITTMLETSSGRVVLAGTIQLNTHK